MATFNTTYNFNQKQPSFWQSFGMGMLYQGMGAFGSLTGCGMGMGGYGMGMGGYGMGMGGCMGMGGSLFGMGGFGMGSYGMGMYGMGGYGMGMGCCGMSDAAFGAQMGLMGVGMVFQSLMGSVAERKAEKANQKTAITNLQNEIDELKKKIENPENYVENEDKAIDTAVENRTTAYNSWKAAESKVAPAEQKVNSLTKERADILAIPETERTLEQKTRLTALGDGTTSGEIKTANDALTQAKKDEADAKTKYDEAQTKVDQAEQVRLTAMNNLVASASEQLEKKLEELNKLQGTNTSDNSSEIETLTKKSHAMSEFAKAAKEYNRIVSDSRKSGTENLAKTTLINAYQTLKATSGVSANYLQMATDKCKELGIDVD